MTAPGGAAAGQPPDAGRSAPGAGGPAGPATEAALWARARRGDAGAREALVARHLGLARHVAARFRSTGLDPEDLEQVAAVGLVKAVNGFDPGRGLRFSTYAVPVITGEIVRFLRDDGPVKISRGARALARRARRVREGLRQALGREPTLDEVAAALEAAPGDVLLALEASTRPISLESPAEPHDGDAPSLLERLAGEVDVAGAGERRVLVRQLLGRLSPTERRAVIMRYFDDLTQQEIAARLGVSQSHVSRVLSRALERLRAWAG
ncbi:MAG TPA: sigma-70 family RNA polymerase sigma factor [Bacillota bacterium]